MADRRGEPPVVSRSTTQNVVSWRGVPRSSNDRCTSGDCRRTCVRLQGSAGQGGLHQAQRRGPELQEGGVEAGIGEPGAPLSAGPVAQVEDLELPPRVPAVGGGEGG